MHLHKTIPTGAGLGGGSADGAATLKLLNSKFHLGLSDEKLMEYALQLGSDCPFFILNKASYATGRGEVLEEVSLDLSSLKLVVVYPDIHINTGWAFSHIQPNDQQTSLKEIINLPVSEWTNNLQNDFEQPVFDKYPEIRQIKMNLMKHGAVYASLSGSGSTVYGLFEKDAIIPSFPDHYFVKIL